MAQTLTVASDRRNKKSETVVPMEVARGTYVANPPSLAALKLMHFMVDHAGEMMGEDIEHKVFLADLNKVDGVRRFSRQDLKDLFVELRQAVLLEGSPNDGSARYTIGGILDVATVDETDAESGLTFVSWYFSRHFTKMAARSEHWAILDSSVVLHCKHRSSILLLNYISSFLKYDHIRSMRFTIPELRSLLGAEGKASERWGNLNQKHLAPAIEELNSLSRLKISVEPHKVGQRFTAVTLHWTDGSKAALKTVKERRTATLPDKAPAPAAIEHFPAVIRAEFPASGGISFDPYWYKIFKDAGCKADNGMVSDAFRGFLKEKGISRTAPHLDKAFSSFCKRYKSNF